MGRKVHIMGIVNLTPDSFWEGSRAGGVEDALQRIRTQFAEGAEVVDVGACSSRPGAAQPSEEEEWARLEPVLTALAGKKISIDTYRSGIVQRAYDVMGPFLVNDISAGQMDPDMLRTVGRIGLPYVAMHMRGTPETMQQMTDYQDIVAAVIAYFRDFSHQAADNGID